MIYKPEQSRTFLQPNPLSDEVREVLRLRLALSQAAVKKYQSVWFRQKNGRLPETLQIWGAGRTGRWAGRGFQLQNLKRPPKGVNQSFLASCVRDGSFDLFYGGLDALEYLGGSVRSVVATGDDTRLVVSDLSAIESRIVGWLAGCRWINHLFEQNKDSYKAFYSMWMGVPYEEVTKEQRTLAKPPFLGFAYRLGGAGLVRYAQGMGVEMAEDLCHSAIQAARDACPEIVNLWQVFEICAEQALGHPGMPVHANHVRFLVEGDFLSIELPSGRKLWYHRPRIEDVQTPWGQVRSQMTYMGQNQFTKKWERLPNHGGRFVEQITQAVAQNVLVHGMLMYSKAGGTVVGHVHDEVIAEEDKDTAEAWLNVLNQCLCTRLSWAPDLILKSEGYVAREYSK